MRPKALALFLVSLSFSSTQAMAEDPVRKAELARIEKETQAQKKEAKDKEAELLPQLKEVQKKVAQKRKTLRQLAMKRSVTGPAAKALEKLNTDLRELEVRIEDVQRPHLERQDVLEQERRRLMKRFPEPADPVYLEVEGTLYTREEWDLEKTRSPANVAEEYVKELLRLDILRSATYTNTTRDAMPMEKAGDGLPIRDFWNVHYTVQYVSKGGVLNERDVWVTVISPDGKHWMVSRWMKELEVLGGLP